MSNFDYEKIPIGYYDKVLTDGLNKKKGIQANWHNKKFLKVYEMISSSKLHLDYGCGPGTFIGNYSEINSIGFDISKVQIDYANKKYGTKFAFNIIPEGGLKNFKNKFDAITMIELIEHLNDQQILKILDELYSLLETDGKIVLTTPNFGSSYAVIEMIVNFIGEVSYKEQHINKFTYKKIVKLLSQSNFSEISVTKFLNIGIFLSFFNTKLGIKINNLLEKIFQGKLGYLLLVELKK